MVGTWILDHDYPEVDVEEKLRCMSHGKAEDSVAPKVWADWKVSFSE